MARFLFGFSGGSITSSHSNPRAWATLVSPWFFVVDGIYITCYITRHINWIAMIEDVVKELGYLALGTRLKRLGERLQAQTQILLEDAGISLPTSHFPVLAALERLGPLSVGELTEAMGVSQPGVTRLVDKLESEGLVQSRQLAGDRRVRTIALTKSGQKLVARSKPAIWPVIEASVADACAGPAHLLLQQLAALEDALAAAPLNVRAERLNVGGRKNAST